MSTDPLDEEFDDRDLRKVEPLAREWFRVVEARIYGPLGADVECSELRDETRSLQRSPFVYRLRGRASGFDSRRDVFEPSVRDAAPVQSWLVDEWGEQIAASITSAIDLVREHYRSVDVRLVYLDDALAWAAHVRWSEPRDDDARYLDGDAVVSPAWAASPEFPAQWRYWITGQTT